MDVSPKTGKNPCFLALLFINLRAYLVQPPSADFQSAVSQTSSLRRVGDFGPPTITQRPADWKSAIQQIGNLRYVRNLATLELPDYVSAYANQSA